MKKITPAFAIFLTLAACGELDYAGFVDTSIGVIDNRESSCVIGPMLPYGSINPSPQTAHGGMDGYRPGEDIDGFGQLHVSGTGWSSYGKYKELGWNPDLESDGYKGFFDARNEDGSFMFIEPKKYGGSWISPFYEATAWTYNCFVPHDFERMIEIKDGGTLEFELTDKI